MKIGRNDPCPCGSGRKYKHCCLGSDEAARAPFRGEAGANAVGALSEEQAKQMMLAQTGFSTTGELDAA
ncbi:MAG: SEC-C domain-containing protein, partial [Spirochaetaceae bacterium]|nr:SEC-C domain-containing protein [Spirochaetaceae bacterium]